jgi:ribosomal protein L12E/L44/L45/RPP1/RPP2
VSLEDVSLEDGSLEEVLESPAKGWVAAAAFGGTIAANALSA